jgi:hypothetical protein
MNSKISLKIVYYLSLTLLAPSREKRWGKFKKCNKKHVQRTDLLFQNNFVAKDSKSLGGKR